MRPEKGGLPVELKQGRLDQESTNGKLRDNIADSYLIEKGTIVWRDSIKSTHPRVELGNPLVYLL